MKEKVLADVAETIDDVVVDEVVVLVVLVVLVEPAVGPGEVYRVAVTSVATTITTIAANAL